MEVVDQLAHLGEPVQAGGDVGGGRTGNAGESARRSSPGCPRRWPRCLPGAASLGSAGERAGRELLEPVQSLAVQPERPRSSASRPSGPTRSSGDRCRAGRPRLRPSGEESREEPEPVATPDADYLRPRSVVGVGVENDSTFPRLEDDCHGLSGISSKRTARGLRAGAMPLQEGGDAVQALAADRDPRIGRLMAAWICMNPRSQLGGRSIFSSG